MCECGCGCRGVRVCVSVGVCGGVCVCECVRGERLRPREKEGRERECAHTRPRVAKILPSWEQLREKGGIPWRSLVQGDRHLGLQVLACTAADYRSQVPQWPLETAGPRMQQSPLPSTADVLCGLPGR